MDLSSDLLLSVLFVAIIVNTGLAVFLVARSRSARRRAHVADVDRVIADSVVATSTVSTPIEAAAAAPEPEPEVGAGDAVAAATADEDPAGAPAGRDVLTGLHDGPAFARLVALEESRVARYQRPATIVVFELDGLERLTETLGVEARDRVVPAVADTIRRLARDADRAARLGPGRFAVLLAETDEVAAINYVERVRRACELWLEAGAIALHLAVGWAGTSGDPTLAESQRIAIERMYGELRRGARRAEGTAPEVSAAPTLTAEPTRIAS